MDSLVIILSETKNETPDSWKNKEETFNKYSIGTVVHINEEQYVLGVNYSVKNAVKTRIITFDTNPLIVNANVVCVSSELNLCLLKMVDFEHSFDVSCDQFNRNLDTNDCKLNFIDFDGESKILSSYDCAVTELMFEKWNCFNMPKMPGLKIDPLDEEFWEVEFNIGLEGALLQQDDDIKGMLFKIYDGDYIAIPSVSILRFINEFTKNGKFKGLCNYTGEFEYEENTNSYVITKHRNLNKKSDNIKKGSRLIGIGEKVFDESGNIFDETCGMPIPLDTYIGLNYTDNELISFQLGDRTEKIILLEALSKYRIIPIEHNHQVYSINGFYFMELSEDLLELYRLDGKYLKGGWLKHITDVPYNKTMKRIYVCVFIDKDVQSEATNAIIDKKHLPFIRKDDSYVLASLTTLNDRKVDVLSKQIDAIYQLGLEVSGSKVNIIF